MRRFPIALLVLVMLATACSRGGSPVGSNGSAHVKASASPAMGTSANGQGSPGSSGSLPGNVRTGTGRAMTLSDRPCQLKRVSASRSGIPAAITYITADPNEIDWGSHCPLFNAGEYCVANFSGSYSAPGSQVFPQFQAWLPGQKKPWLTRTIGPLPAAAGDFKDWYFGFRVPDAKAILIRMVLLNDHKAEIADGDSWARGIGCYRHTVTPSR